MSLIHFLVFAFADSFEFGEAGGFGAVVEFCFGAADGWGGDDFGDGVAAFGAGGEAGVGEALGGFEAVGAVGAGVVRVGCGVVVCGHDFLLSA